MDKAEAQSLIDREIDTLRELSYAELRERIPAKREGFLFIDIREAIQVATREVTVDSGAVYRVETMVMWDGKADEAIRVVVSIDDARLSAFISVTGDFVMAPDGSYVAESLSDD
jgi:hypothetical protein